MYLLSNAKSRDEFKRSEKIVKYIFFVFASVLMIINVTYNVYVDSYYVTTFGSIWEDYVLESEIYVSIKIILMISSGVTLLYYLKKFYHFEYQK